MTRRDTIIIATLVNAGLLACLFVAATRQEDKMAFAEPMPEALESAQTTASTHSSLPPSYTQEEAIPLTISDEVDLALKEFLPDEPKLTEASQIGLEADLNPDLLKENTKQEVAVSVAAATNIDPSFKVDSKIVEVTVKSGDMLEKIAKANNTTVKAIKEASNLVSDKLKVGQILKVPVGKKPMKEPVKSPTVMVAGGEPIYYIVQKGDNPWKIAKKFHVKFEDILKLNSMSEEKAKNLKVGQEIRVK